MLHALLRVARTTSQARDAALAGHGLDQGRLDVLGALHAAGQPYRLTAGELTRWCQVTPGATTQRLTALEQAGLVERVRQAPDRRTVHVRLTDLGLTRHTQACSAVRAADDGSLAALGALGLREREQLRRALVHWAEDLVHASRVGVGSAP